MADTTSSHKIGPSTSTSSPLSSIDQPVFLELCIKSGPETTRLAEIVIVDGTGQHLITTDLELFASIRKAYNSMRRKCPFFALLFRPDDIRYVTFGVHTHRVDIFDNNSFPPPDEVDEKRYHYFPCPLALLPPMPRHSFFQYYRQRRNCHPQSTFFINRLPKKLGTSMTVLSKNNPSGLEFGWGIHIIERPNRSAIAALYAGLFVLGLIFAVSYNAYMGTSDSALTYGLWIVATLAVALSAVYFHLVDG
jgi:hypothetical protein